MIYEHTAEIVNTVFKHIPKHQSVTIRLGVECAFKHLHLDGLC